MRIGMPHMGNLYIPFTALLKRLDIDFIVPPVNNQRTLSLGVRHSPEGMLKLIWKRTGTGPLTLARAKNSGASQRHSPVNE